MRRTLVVHEVIQRIGGRNSHPDLHRVLAVGVAESAVCLEVQPATYGHVEFAATLICVKAHMRMIAYQVLMHMRINDLLTALSEPTRLRTLQILWDGDEHCVCELMDRLGATQSRMSRHMARLKTVGLLMDRRDAQWVRYRRAPDLPPAAVEIVDAVLAALLVLPTPQRQKQAA